MIGRSLARDARHASLYTAAAHRLSSCARPSRITHSSPLAAHMTIIHPVNQQSASAQFIPSLMCPLYRLWLLLSLGLLWSCWLLGCSEAQPAPPATLVPAANDSLPSLPSFLPNATPPSLASLPPPSSPSVSSSPSSSSLQTASSLALSSSVSFSSAAVSSALLSSRSVVVSVLRLGSSAQSVSVNFSSVDLSAVSGLDYGGGGGALLWPAGDATQRDITFQLQPSARSTEDGSIDATTAASAIPATRATTGDSSQPVPGLESNASAVLVARQFAVLLFSPVNAILGSPDSCLVTMQTTQPDSESAPGGSTGQRQSSSGASPSSSYHSSLSSASTSSSSTATAAAVSPALSSSSSAAAVAFSAPTSASSSASSHSSPGAWPRAGTGCGLDTLRCSGVRFVSILASS